MSESHRDWRYWVGSAGGLGLSPIVPGSCATLLGVAFHAAVVEWVPTTIQWPTLMGIFLVVNILHFRLTPWAQAFWNDPDPAHFVLDEVSGYLLVPIILEWARLPEDVNLWKTMALSYIAFRLLDIIKVPPARQVDQQMKGAWGVVLDDWISAFYAAGVVVLVARTTSWIA